MSYDISKKRYVIGENDNMLTKMTVNLMGAYYSNNEYDEAIKIGNEVLKIKQKLDSYGKIHFIFFLLHFHIMRKKCERKQTSI